MHRHVHSAPYYLAYFYDVLYSRPNTVGTDHAKNGIVLFTYSECDHMTKEPRIKDRIV